VLKRIFRPKREEVTERRKLHNVEFHNLKSSTNNIIRLIKSMNIIWVEHVSHMREMKKAYMRG
jgi:hypothetical protein